MSRQLQPSVPLVIVVKTESPTVIKNEPPEEVLEKVISPDIKDIDIVYHSLSEDLIKNETVPENILETKYSKFVETQVLVKTEDTSDENVTRGTGQEMIEVQGVHEHCNTLSNLTTHEQLVLNSSNETSLWEKEKEKIKIITARDPVESHEYTSLVEDEHVCNRCQRAYKGLHSLEYHIREMHRKIMYYQCPYCPHKSKWRGHVKQHIILKHKDTKDIQWFQCNLCEMKFKLKIYLTQHMKKIHLRHKQLKDGLDSRAHLKAEDIPHFHCYHCSYKSKQKWNLQRHIFKHLKNGEIKFDCYICNFMTQKRESFIEHIKKHSKVQIKFN